jgi:F-type H+-transporting ATPase subunit delta
MSFSNKVITTYAKSLFQNVNNPQKGIKKDGSFSISKLTSSEQKTLSPDIFILGEELLLIRAILISSNKLNMFFKNPTYLEQQKLDIILTLFPGLTLTMKSFLKVLKERNHLSLLPEISDEYNKIILKFKNSTKVKLITASALDENMGSLLLNSLKKVTNSTEIILNTAYNPKLLGGVIIEYNSVALDASVLKEFSLFFNDI